MSKNLVADLMTSTQHQFVMLHHIDECNDQGDTALVCAARRGNTSLCRSLLEHGANINVFNPYDHQTPLLVAIDNHHVEVVNLLLEHGADVQMADNVGITPIYSAIRIKDEAVRDELLTQLISAGCDVNVGSQDHVPLFLAARLGTLSVAKKLCDANCDVNISNKYGVTPVYEAVIKGHNCVLEFLLSEGCCVNKQDMYGVSALHVAAMFDNREAVKLLLKARACVKSRDQHGRCPVHVAIEEGKASVVEIFLKHGVDILCPPTSIKKLPCLWRAAERGCTDTISVLIRGCSSLPVDEIKLSLKDNIDLLGMYIESGVDRVQINNLRHYLASFQDCSAEVSSLFKQYYHSVPSLKQSSRVRIRRCLSNKILHSVNLLPLPTSLQNFVSLDGVL